MRAFVWAVLFILGTFSGAIAQIANPGVQQKIGTTVTPGNVAIWTQNGVIEDGGLIPGDISGVDISSSNITVTGSPCASGACAFTVDLPITVTGASVGSATVTPVLTFDNFGRVTNISSATIAPPFSALTGQATCAQLPAFTGDTTKPNASCAQTTVKVNGVAYSAAPAVDTVPLITAANTATYTAIPNCTSGVLQYTTATHLFSCGVAGSGTVTSIGITPSASLSVSGSPVTGSGNITVTYRAPTMQSFNTGTAQTYTTPANVSALKVTLCSATGGGAGSGTGVTGGTGGTGGTSSFSGQTLSCTGGTGGTGGSNGGVAGGCSSGSGTNFTFVGAPGQSVITGLAASFTSGGQGGSTPFIGTMGGRGGAFNGAGNNGPGGGGGACIVTYIPSPAASYTYTIGAAGTAGTAGTSGAVGTAGMAGALIVEEF